MAADTAVSNTTARLLQRLQVALQLGYMNVRQALDRCFLPFFELHQKSQQMITRGTYTDNQTTPDALQSCLQTSETYKRPDSRKLLDAIRSSEMLVQAEGKDVPVLF